WRIHPTKRGVAMDARFTASLGLGPKFVTRWAIGCIAAIAIAGSTLAETPVERGSYLVNGILTCGNCHTPRSSSGAWDMSKQLSGRPRTWDEATFKVNAANITPDLETGLGKGSEADMTDPVKRGFYLVTIGHCMECHTPLVNDVHDYAQLGKGGQPFPGPWGVAVSRNITSHPTAGLGAWSDAEIKSAITQGVRKD